MQKTANYGLNKPDQTDFYEIGDFNENMDIIDSKLKEVAESGIDEHIADHRNPHQVTAEQIGLGNIENKSINDQTPTYTSATTLAELTSGEKLSVAFGKIAKAVKDLISHISDTTKHITTVASTTANGLMSSEMVKKLNGVATGANKTIVVDNLTTASATSALSAGQGKVLKEGLDQVNTNLDANVIDALNSIDLTSYSALNPYIAERDGYVTLKCAKGTGQFATINILTSKDNAVDRVQGSSDNTEYRLIYVKKGMKMFGVVSDKTYGAVTFAPLI